MNSSINNSINYEIQGVFPALEKHFGFQGVFPISRRRGNPGSMSHRDCTLAT